MGSLVCLRRLQEQSEALKLRQDEQLRHKKQLEMLQTKVETLRREKYRLQQQHIQEMQTCTLQERIGREMADAVQQSESQEIWHEQEKAIHQELTCEALQAHETLEARNRLLGYRLAGTTLFRVSLPCQRAEALLLGLRLETMFQGQYFESYYVVFEAVFEEWQHRSDVQLQPGQTLGMYKHTIPASLPWRSYYEEYQTHGDLKRFVQQLGSILNAYVSRREQLAQVLETFKHVQGHERSFRLKMMNAVATKGYDLISLQFIVLNGSAHENGENATSERVLEIKLGYDNIADDLPTRIEVHDSCDRSNLCIGNVYLEYHTEEDERKIRSLKQTLSCKTLLIALLQYVAQEDL